MVSEEVQRGLLARVRRRRGPRRRGFLPHGGLAPPFP